MGHLSGLLPLSNMCYHMQCKAHDPVNLDVILNLLLVAIDLPVNLGYIDSYIYLS